jgi:hypothetical protein
VVVQSGSAIGQLFVGFVANSTTWWFRNLTLTSIHNATAIRAAYGCRIQFDSIVFGFCGSGVHLLANYGGYIGVVGNYTISGGAAMHFFAELNGGIPTGGRTITLTGNPAFSLAFASATTGGVVISGGNTFVGAATGKRYEVSLNAVVNTFGGGANALPGNIAGTVVSGGQYA